ncbi:MAG: purine-binding chemotaxis protein CheW [Chthoniobacter sp.]|jgi:purine-binding chemotaxis protein CheW|nr:purine-binding chemotaxis protein CheW [Chthoniobacter sp.]
MAPLSKSKRSLTPEDETRILKERARELASEPVAASAPVDLIQVVEFELAGEGYGIELARVRQVIALKEITPVPCTPRFVLGIINLRGEIQTVIDIRKFFDLPDRGITQLNRIIVIQSEGLHLGILADAIRGVRTIPRDSLQPPGPTFTGVRADYLRGVTEDRMAVLDAAKILSDEGITIYEEVEG